MITDIKSIYRFRPIIIGAVVEFAAFTTVLTGFFWRGGSSWLLAVGVIGSVLAGSVTIVCVVRRLNFLLAGFVGGLLIGVISAWQLLVTEPFENQYFVVIATLAFYPILGFLIGAIVEFVAFLHFILHGNVPRNYSIASAHKESEGKKTLD